MNEVKERLTFRPEAETRKKIEYWYGQDGCRSMNDFIEKAVNFYIGYLEANDKNAYLPKVLRSVIEGSIGKFEDRMAHLMFKQSVETDMMATLTAHDHELSEEAMRRLRTNSVRNVKATKGRMSLEDHLREPDDLFYDEADEQKSEARQELVRAARQSMRELAKEMQSGFVDFPEQEMLMQQLSEQLKTVRGKHSYGYLPKDMKQLIDKIVDNMLQVKIVSDCYDRWLVLQGRVDNFYVDGSESKPRLPLSQVKEFRAIKNAVIKVADDIRLGRVTFEDEALRQDDEHGEASRSYWQLRYVIEDEDHSLDEKDCAIEKMKVLAAQDDLHAQYYLGKLYRDGGIALPDSKLAEKYLKSAAERGMLKAQYALGKLCLSDDEEVHDAAQGIRWLDAAAELGSSDAAYLLGKLYLPKDREKAVHYFEQAAQKGNPCAQYALGKIFLAEHNTERGMAYMEQAAENGSECAYLFLNRRDSLTEPQLMLAATRLLYHMGRIFQDNSLPQTGAVQHIDRKRRRKLQAKRIAHGHKPDDHEEYQGPSMVM